MNDLVPRLFDRGRAEHEQALEVLRQAGKIVEVFDTIRSQAGELVRSRNPSEKLAGDALERAVTALLGEEPDRHGWWVHYPWSGRLVHVLPEAEHFELRTSRNQNKITRDEQRKLAQLKLGIVGLSVGQATALTLTLEGIGGELRLADHDVLSLSNMNRLRAGLHEIGVNKTIITARAIWEINPYAKLVLFPEGIDEENIARFLDGIDLVFEECDDLAMKIRIREAARERRIAVLMETSDRGMLDVERFDLEPERPLLHGLIGDVDSRSLRGLTTAEKVPFILSMIGQVSPRAAASLVDIDTTLETWPQLASAVSLGAAINADCARRIALGAFRESGRFYVDLEQIVGGIEETGELLEPESREPLRKTPDEPKPLSSIETVVRFASLAPSGGNCQPWRFVHRPRTGELECWHDRQRSESMLDFEDRASYVALGAALENARLACHALGIEGAFERMTGPSDRAWTLRIGSGTLARTPDDDLLARTVELRVTNRKLGERKTLPDGVAEALVRTAFDAGARLDLVEDAQAIAAIGEIVARAEKLRILHPVLHREMIDELRWTTRQAERTKDGLDVATLELSAADAAGLQLLRSPAIVRTIRSIGAGDGLKKSARNAAAASSAIALVRVPGIRDLRAYLRGGEALQRTWLLANARGVAVQPMTALLYLFARVEEGGGRGLEEPDRKELRALRSAFDGVMGAHDGAEIMLFRLAIAAPPTARSLRRTVDEILSPG